MQKMLAADPDEALTDGVGVELDHDEALTKGPWIGNETEKLLKSGTQHHLVQHVPCGIVILGHFHHPLSFLLCSHFCHHFGWTLGQQWAGSCVSHSHCGCYFNQGCC